MNNRIAIGVLYWAIAVTATMAVILPVRTRILSEASLLIRVLYKSIVKMVEELFVIELNDETMAAIRAANTSPFKPTPI